MKKNTRQVPPLEMRADVTSINVEKRTFEVMFSTGAKVLRSSWYDGPFYEELSMDPKAIRMGRLASGTAPFLTNHDGSRVEDIPGVIESARLEGGKGYATVRMVREGVDPEADKLFAKIADKIVRNVSVGYRTYKVEKTEGVETKVPTLRAVDWEPYEISSVAMGAEQGAGIRSDVEANNLEIVSPLGIPSITTNERKADMDPEELKKQQAAQAAEQQKRQAEIDAEVTRRVTLENERQAGIKHAVRVAKLDESTATKLIADNVSLDKARAFVLDELAKRTEAIPTEQHTSIEVTDDAADKWARQATAWLLTRSGDVAHRAKSAGVAGFKDLDLDPGLARGMSLIDLAREHLERRGVKTRGMDRMTLVGRAFTERSGGVYSGTSDFTTMLENVIGKILLGAYATTPDTWSRFCKTDTVPDFRASPRYRTGSLNVLDALSENGEFKNKSIPDASKQSISVGTKGNIIGISRQLVINDDMGALNDLMTKLGRAARLSVEVDVYALLAQNSGAGPTQSDSQPFFHAANRGNVGTAGALSVASIDADRVTMGVLKDAQNNEYLDVRPSILLVPIGLGAAARVINTSAYNHDSTKLQQPNSVQGLFRDIIDTPRLSGTRRYMFADPAVIPAIVVAFLEGQGQSPVIETEQGWRVDGAEMKIRFDYQAQMFDPKGALTNAGA